MAFGAILGYVAATGEWVAVERPASASAVESAGVPLPIRACCRDGSDRNTLLAPVAATTDKFFGNRYHLNAEEEPEQRTDPRVPEFKRTFGPRRALRCKATDRIDETVDARLGSVGKQALDDIGISNDTIVLSKPR